MATLDDVASAGRRLQESLRRCYEAIVKRQSPNVGDAPPPLPSSLPLPRAGRGVNRRGRLAHPRDAPLAAVRRPTSSNGRAPAPTFRDIAAALRRRFDTRQSVPDARPVSASPSTPQVWHSGSLLASTLATRCEAMCLMSARNSFEVMVHRRSLARHLSQLGVRSLDGARCCVFCHRCGAGPFDPAEAEEAAGGPSTAAAAAACCPQCATLLVVPDARFSDNHLMRQFELHVDRRRHYVLDQKLALLADIVALVSRADAASPGLCDEANMGRVGGPSTANATAPSIDRLKPLTNRASSVPLRAISGPILHRRPLLVALRPVEALLSIGDRGAGVWLQPAGRGVAVPPPPSRRNSPR